MAGPVLFAAADADTASWVETLDECLARANVEQTEQEMCGEKTTATSMKAKTMAKELP
jgi:predicted class III extradiol MEMO1 family dioxygenase